MGNSNTGISLPYMNADANSVTVSGHSAGCHMSERMLMIHSSTIKGAGLFACWPYGVDFDDIHTSNPDTAENIAAHSIADIDAAATAE